MNISTTCTVPSHTLSIWDQTQLLLCWHPGITGGRERDSKSGISRKEIRGIPWGKLVIHGAGGIWGTRCLSRSTSHWETVLASLTDLGSAHFPLSTIFLCPVGPLIGRYCGTKIPPEIQSSTGLLSLSFHTDMAVAKDGFSARYNMTHKEVSDSTYNLSFLVLFCF